MLRVVCVGLLSLVLGWVCFAADQGRQRPQDSTVATDAPPPRVQPRQTPLTLMRSSANADAWKVLTGGVADKKAVNRIAALTALADLGAVPQGVRLVSRSLADNDADVRKQAALTLGMMRSPLAIPRLRAALQDQDAAVSFAAAQALWNLGDHSGRNILFEVLEGERSATTGFVDTQVRGMRHRLQNPKSLVGMGAEKGASALLGPFSFGIPVAKQMLANPVSSQRALTVSLLSHEPDAQTVEALKKALSDKDWTVRQASVRAAADLHRRDFIPVLTPLLNDNKLPVSFSAAVAIVRLTSPMQTLSRSNHLARAESH
jgi:HEAT repeat protein